MVSHYGEADMDAEQVRRAAAAIARAQAEKTRKLVVAIDDALAAWGIVPWSAEALSRVEALDDAGWATAARVAGCRPPNTTRAMVVAIYKQRAEHNGLPVHVLFANAVSR